MLILTILMGSCTTFDSRIAINDVNNQAMQVFLEFERYARRAKDFESLLVYFHPSEREKVKSSIGWSKLVYSAPYLALTQGNCEKLYLTEASSRKVVVNCKGPFIFKSAFGFQSEETMHLKTYVVRLREEWFISKSGLSHTMQGRHGKPSVSRKIGLKFN